MSPKFLNELRKLVETLDKHPAGSRYLIALAGIAAGFTVAVAALGRAISH